MAPPFIGLYTAHSCKRTAALAALRLRFVIAGICGVLGLLLVATGSAQPVSSSISGRVLYRGQAPPPVFVPESGGASPVLRIDRDSAGLQYAVVYVEPRDTRAPEARRAPVTVVQRGFVFEPPVVAVAAGQDVRFTNDDSSNHNVRSADPMPRNRFNAYTGAGQEYVHRFTKPAVAKPIVLSCDIHEWMAGWVYVFDHPWFAVTDAQGRFRIDGVPRGSYAVGVRQPAGGLARDMRVGVSEGEPAIVEIVFGTEDLRKPIR